MMYPTPEPMIIFLAQMLILALPLILSLLPVMSKMIWSPKKAMTMALLLSLISLATFTLQDLEMSTYTIHSSTILDINMNTKFSLVTAVFTFTALFITRMILEYTEWYMANDQDQKKFSLFLLMFLMTMLIFISANDLFLLFIGWETMGMLSFLLISWWRGRVEATTSGLKAIIYNRLADIGMFLFMAWTFTKLSTLNLDIIYSNPKMITILPATALILAAVGKSAQFGFHPWLPAAMEGPTPVSALLHSSTMVTAGILMLLRLFPVLMATPFALYTCLILGTITTLYASIQALTKNDIKKIIAYSTLSQLGLMLATIGLGEPVIAFLHVCLHAFFKANMFLCSGVISHTLHGEQDIRKMGGLTKLLPTTSICMIISTLSLAGFPYLTAFYSKETIMKLALSSYTNMACMLMIMASILFTTMYSLRMTYIMLTGKPWYNQLPTFNEHPMYKKPIIKLTMMSIITGFLFINYLPFNHLTPLIITPLMTLIMLSITTLMVTIALALINHTTQKPLPTDKCMEYLKNLSEDMDGPLHRKLADKSLEISQLEALQMLDKHWKETAGSKYIKGCLTPPMLHSTSLKGTIKPYMLSFILLFLLALCMVVN
uniref:NADH-ubiquinone oxidoreductase chain 5 n=1 Tax=Peltocephalus dumerilianus TaxID=329145 RepID=A0A1Z4EAV7_9SAUR|nr:NADH dehydrogenase subunit 5 [Peltocephalus dumerilianus]